LVDELNKVIEDNKKMLKTIKDYEAQSLEQNEIIDYLK